MTNHWTAFPIYSKDVFLDGAFVEGMWKRLCAVEEERDLLRQTLQSLIDNKKIANILFEDGECQDIYKWCQTVLEVYQPTITYSGPPPTNFVMAECSKCRILTRSNTTCEACGHLNVTTVIKEDSP